jgi:hypothetical protein
MSMLVALPDGAAPIVAAIAIPALVIYYAWYFPRSRSVLEHWATRNGFEITHSERRWLFLGPFAWRTGRGQTVYYVKVRSHEGFERSGWVCCGGIWTGLFTNKAEVIWEDKP